MFALYPLPTSGIDHKGTVTPFPHFLFISPTTQTQGLWQRGDPGNTYRQKTLGTNQTRSGPQQICPSWQSQECLSRELACSTPPSRPLGSSEGHFLMKTTACFIKPNPLLATTAEREEAAPNTMGDSPPHEPLDVPSGRAPSPQPWTDR